jgi:glycerophosphoryl diester phosphodiesterase
MTTTQGNDLGGGDDGGSDADGDDGDGADPTLIAHRGFAGVYPGNTLAAIRGAAADGADYIEIDVQACADGQVVVFHDRRLDATTDRKGIVAETPSGIVLDAEVLDSGETVPTLDAVMDAIPPDVGVNVELKGPGRPETGGERGSSDRRERWVPLVERALGVCTQYDNTVLLSSFHAPALAAAHEVDATVPLAPLLADAVDRAFVLARRFDCVAIHPSIRSTDRALIERAHAEGFAVNAYTVTEPAQATRLRRLGVDGVVADAASVLDP